MSRCSRCGGDHALELAALEERERRLRGPEVLELDRRSAEAARMLSELVQERVAQAAPQPGVVPGFGADATGV